MNPPQTALLLVGSPRAHGGVSEMLGRYVLQCLAERGIETQSIRILPALARPAGTQEMLQATLQTDLLILSYPLYVDSLPAQTIRALQLIARERQRQDAPHEAGFVAIANCGFPENVHNLVSLQICERFARESGLQWLGGLSMGMGGALNGGGLTLDSVGGRAHNIRFALRLAAESLALGQPLPPEAVARMAKPIIPIWLYRLFGNLGWILQARQNRIREGLDLRPFHEPSGRGSHQS